MIQLFQFPLVGFRSKLAFCIFQGISGDAKWQYVVLGIAIKKTMKNEVIR